MNKFLAKIASDLNKPNGLSPISPEQAEAFLDQLPIERFHGIGAKTAHKMRQLGVHNGADLKTWSELDLSQHFGKVGRHFFRIVRAIDDRPVEPKRERKSVGIETTFHQDLTHEAEMGDALRSLAEKVCKRLERLEMAAMTVTLKIKYQDFVQVTALNENYYTIKWVHEGREGVRRGLERTVQIGARAVKQGHEGTDCSHCGGVIW